MTALPKRDQVVAPERGDAQARMQQAIGVAAMIAEAGVATNAQEEQALRRIAQQRLRIAERGVRSAHTRSARAPMAGLAGDGSAAAGTVRTALAAQPLLAAGRDAALRHPLAVGFALGVGLVLGPRRLLRTAVWAAPWVLRGWRLVERGNARTAQRR